MLRDDRIWCWASHATRHTSHVTRHTSHVTRHHAITSPQQHRTPGAQAQYGGSQRLVGWKTAGNEQLEHALAKRAVAVGGVMRGDERSFDRGLGLRSFDRGSGLCSGRVYLQKVRRGSTLERVLGMARVASGRVTEAMKASSMPASSAALATCTMQRGWGSDRGGDAGAAGACAAHLRDGLFVLEQVLGGLREQRAQQQNKTLKPH